MVGTRVLIIFTLPVLASCIGDGNIHLLEEEVAEALRICSNENNKAILKERQRRSNENMSPDPSPRIDSNTKQEANQYSHERRNTSVDNRNKIHILNGTDYSNYSKNDYGELINTVPRPVLGGASAKLPRVYGNSNRRKRDEPLLSKEDNEQCLSQCVFANLQVVDSKGIPREAELWNKLQRLATSQQSRTLLKDQMRACFQELQTESEDNGCYYSNKLERCLMLRFSDRKVNGTQDSLYKKN